MDKIALAKRLESLSKVFADQTPYNRDLLAMSYALSKMNDDKYKTVLSSDFEAESLEDVESCLFGKGPGPMGPGPGKPKIIIVEDENSEEDTEGIPVMAKEKSEGMFWDKAASNAVVDNLLRDVVGMDKSICCDTNRKLEADQIPDGSHKGIPETPESLKKEQTPNIAESLDSNMVEKSKGKVRKEAGSKKGPGVPDGTGPHSGTPKCQMNKDDEKEASESSESSETPEKEATEEKKAEVEDIITENSDKIIDDDSDKEEDSEEEESEEITPVEEETTDEEITVDSCKKEATSSIVEGIELLASMDEVSLEKEEADKLSKLFE